MAERNPGVLYVVGTPIGNRGDLSPRGLETLGWVKAIVAEDTRHVQRLLSGTETGSERISLNAHNETERIPVLVERLERGDSLALVSDAGMPSVSDPGGRLVEAAHRAGLPVRSVPGPSALTAALAVSGFSADRFVFEGFLPTKTEARRQRLRELAREERTVALFESPRRIAGLLADLAELFGPDREALVARELTKRFETNRRGALAGLAEHFGKQTGEQRGEFVVVVRGVPKGKGPEARTGLNVDLLLEALLEELSPSRAARTAARVTHRSKRELYERALALRSGR